MLTCLQLTFFTHQHSPTSTEQLNDLTPSLWVREKNLRWGLNLVIDVILHAMSEEETGRFRVSLPWHCDSILHPGENSKSQLTWQSQPGQNTRSMKPPCTLFISSNYIPVHDTTYINVSCEQYCSFITSALYAYIWLNWVYNARSQNPQLSIMVLHM